MISDYKGDEYQRIEYTPYGETWVEKTQNTGLEFLPYKFTAKELDKETGLYYYGARYLDPKYSRWISAAPALGEYMLGSSAGEGGAYNSVNISLYHYAGNNPIKYTDPDGNSLFGVITGIGCYIGAGAVLIAGTFVVATTAGTTAVVVAPGIIALAGELSVAGTAILTADYIAEKIGSNLALKSNTTSDSDEGNSESGSLNKPNPLPEEGAESNKTKPQNKSPEGAGRKGALREAKRKNRIPTSQPPESQTPNYDKRGKLQPGRQYRYRDSEGNPVDIRDDAKGHEYPDNPNQNRGPHFNDKAGNHYDY